MVQLDVGNVGLCVCVRVCECVYVRTSLSVHVRASVCVFRRKMFVTSEFTYGRAKFEDS